MQALIYAALRTRFFFPWHPALPSPAPSRVENNHPCSCISSRQRSVAPAGTHGRIFAGRRCRVPRGKNVLQVDTLIPRGVFFAPFGRCGGGPEGERRFTAAHPPGADFCARRARAGAERV